MPAIQISREALATLKRYHTSDEIANALFAVADYFWTGKDPDGLTSKELDAFETIMEYSKQKADGWLNAHNKRVESAIETNKKKAAKKQQEIQPNHDFENEAPTQPSNIETKPISEPIQSPKEESNIPMPEVVIKPQNEPFTDYQYTKLRDMADDYVRMVQQVNNGTLSKDAAWNQIYAGLDAIGIPKDRAKEVAEYWYKVKFNAA